MVLSTWQWLRYRRGFRDGLQIPELGVGYTGSLQNTESAAKFRRASKNWKVFGFKGSFPCLIPLRRRAPRLDEWPPHIFLTWRRPWPVPYSPDSEEQYGDEQRKSGESADETDAFGQLQRRRDEQRLRNRRVRKSSAVRLRRHRRYHDNQTRRHQHQSRRHDDRDESCRSDHTVCAKIISW